MDGDQQKQHERFIRRSSNAPGRLTEFESMHPRGGESGGDQGISEAPDRSPQISYDYASYTDNPFQGDPYSARLRRQMEAQPAQHRSQRMQHQPQHHQQQQQDTQSFVQYESGMLYGFGQQGPVQGPFDVVSQYSTRQSAAIEALSNQFAVPQYFAPEEPSGTGVPGLSSYMNPQIPYNQPSPIARPSTTQSFSTTMPDFISMGVGSSRLDPSPLQHPDPSHQTATASSSIEHSYFQYQRRLRTTFDRTRAGRLIEANTSLLEISDWLVTNARDLGILRDDHLVYPDRLRFWNEFNLCWLALCQKQKELSQDYITTGQLPAQTNLISRDRLEQSGKELIQICDQLEQHGLVDYQMGIWEEEILCVLGQCIDLMEKKPELRHMVQSIPTCTSST
ncbi:hypothetical protein N7495_003052 [Penicillium taxi]|uniref:uncharacterized protein n=1 Tax=Penicillium taxi TaxID=168475 RepID=UPI002545A7E2|nr:uncharacterized protein N7495_003052 [Penicillium taxi]KAJ5902524.1 hypothetical protein N7495_003052 [Penicillium taxi]